MSRFTRFLGLATVLFAACQGESTGRGAKSSVLATWSGHQGAGDTLVTEVLRTPEAWNALWHRLGRDVPRVLDATHEIGVFIGVGERRSGGYSIAVVRIEKEGDAWVVHYRETPPPPDAMVTLALTTPWAAAIVPRADGAVVFRADPTGAIGRESGGRRTGAPRRD